MKIMRSVLCLLLLVSMLAGCNKNTDEAGKANGHKTKPTQTVPTETEAPEEPEEVVPEENRLDPALDQNVNGLPDCMENDDRSTDTDGDGLSDYDEFTLTFTDPMELDTNNNGINDFDEDQDGDGLSNGVEVQKGTLPTASDSDQDGLNDKKELEDYHTDPLKADTDGDGATDGWEVENGSDPNRSEDIIEVESSYEGDNASVSVELSASGETVESLRIESAKEDACLNDTIPGYLDTAFEIKATGEIGRTKITITFDSALLNQPDVKPTIYSFNEATQSWYEYNTVLRDNTAIAETTYCTKFVLLDKTQYDAYLTALSQVDFSQDDGTDSNNDGISDFVTKLMCDGVIRTGTGTLIFGDYTYDEVQANDDIDGDGLKNGEEVVLNRQGVTEEDVQEFGGHFYKKFDSVMTWEEARVHCENLGGYLATPTSAEENAFIYSVISSGSKNLYWIGGYESSIEGDWHWVTAEPFSYENWGTGEPNNSGNEGYAEMYKNGDNGRKPGEWNDMKNEGDSGGFYTKEKTGFVCEWNSAVVLITIESSPALADTDRDGFTDDLDPTPTKAECFSSMTDYKKYYFDDEITVTLCVSQPEWDSRICYKTENALVRDPYWHYGGTGHTYLGIDYKDETKYYFGYYPGEATSGSLSLVLFKENVSGYVQGELYTETGGSHLESEGHPIFTVAKTFVIDEIQLEKILNYKESHQDDAYNITRNNCTTFAVECLKKSGVKVNVFKHYWTLDDGALKFHLGEDYPTISLQPTKIINAIYNLYYGYSPADTAQDLRFFYDDCVALRNYTLKDGSEVGAYEVLSKY